MFCCFGENPNANDTTIYCSKISIAEIENKNVETTDIFECIQHDEAKYYKYKVRYSYDDQNMKFEETVVMPCSSNFITYQRWETDDDGKKWFFTSDPIRFYLFEYFERAVLRIENIESVKNNENEFIRFLIDQIIDTAME